MIAIKPFETDPKSYVENITSKSMLEVIGLTNLAIFHLKTSNVGEPCDG
jgi:hypothetical protein